MHFPLKGKKEEATCEDWGQRVFLSLLGGDLKRNTGG